MTHEEYYQKAVKLCEDGAYEKALEAINEAIELDRIEASNNGCDGAFSDTYFNIRIDIYIKLKQDKKALDVFEFMINQNHAYQDYYKRGEFYFQKKKYDDALRDFEQVVNNPLRHLDDHSLKSDAYLYIGAVYYKKKEYDSALKSFKSVIKFNPKNSTAYLGIGKIYYEHLNQPKEALENFILSVTFDFNNYFHIHKILKEEDLVTFKENIIKNFEIWENEGRFLPLIKEVVNLDEEPLLNRLKDLYLKQLELTELLKVRFATNTNDPSCVNYFPDGLRWNVVGHYTSLDVAKAMLIGKERSSLRSYTLSKANDPKEGKVLEHLLEYQSSNSNKDQYLVFQTSFTAHIDGLTQFRLYGNKGKEGTGVCLVLHENAFEQDGSFEPLINSFNAPKTKYPLYWVLYYNKEDKSLTYTPEVLLSKTYLDASFRIDHSEEEKRKTSYKDVLKRKEDIITLLAEILDTAKKIKKDYSDIETINDILEDVLVYVRYLIKFDGYKEEAECRILSIKGIKDETIRVFEGQEPQSLYIDLFKLNSERLSCIMLGPNVDKAQQTAEVLKYKSDILKSVCFSTQFLNT